MKRLNIEVGTQIKIKTAPQFGVCTVDKIGQRVDEFGDKTGELHARYKSSDGVTRGCTPLSFMCDEWFEVI